MITPYLPSFIDEKEIEFLEYSSMELVWLVRVVLPLVLVSADEVLVVQRPTRPCSPGLPGRGRVEESFDIITWRVFISGLSATTAWQHNNANCMHIAASLRLHVSRLSSTSSNCFPVWKRLHVCSNSSKDEGNWQLIFQFGNWNFEKGKMRLFRSNRLFQIIKSKKNFKFFKERYAIKSTITHRNKIICIFS